MTAALVGDAYYTDLYEGEPDARTESGENGGFKDGSEYDD